MLMQDAFRRALDQLEQDRQAPNLDMRNLTVLQYATVESTETPRQTVGVKAEKLVYTARRLARRWCCYTRATSGSFHELNSLRDDWVVFARQLVALPAAQRDALLWELARAMQPERIERDVERCRYLVRQAAAHPELLSGLVSSTTIPWPGPASFLVHAIAELEGASAEERADLYQELDEQVEDGSLWLIHGLARWVNARYHTMAAELG